MDQDYAEKISHLNDLVTLSKVDGYESAIEMNFIISVANRMGVSEEDVLKLREESKRIKFTPPKYEYQIIPQFHRLVLLMGIDRMIYREEIRFLTDLGLKMGLNLHAVKEVLEKMVFYPNNIIPAEEMEAIFKKYYN
jgi:hypothetical protein